MIVSHTHQTSSNTFAVLQVDTIQRILIKLISVRFIRYENEIVYFGPSGCRGFECGLSTADSPGRQISNINEHFGRLAYEQYATIHMG